MFNKLAMEQAIVESNFKKTFEPSKQGVEAVSAYQSLLNADDDIALRGSQYTFMNGKSQAHYETSALESLELPGINRRFKMPESATRDIAERHADTGAILLNCSGMGLNQAKRMLILKHFQDLLKENNPERDYNFMDRCYQEHFDPATFRQVLCEAIRREPDVNTHYYDKEDALLIALNYKNPQGRLLRRQWTHKQAAVPSFQDWREMKQEVKMPKECLNIDQKNLSTVRQN